jgi:hypothetical protein
MRRRATQILVVVGVSLFCFVITAFAQNNGNNGNNGNSANNGNNGNSANNGNNGNSANHISAPEIDMGAAAGALTIAAGTLALLRERLRRP